MGAAEEHQNLIPGLPDHISVHNVLSRISWWDFNSALTVSRGWHSAVQNEHAIHPTTESSSSSKLKKKTMLGCIHPARRRDSSSTRHNNNTTNSFFAISVLDPDTSSWERLPAIPGLSCGAPLSCRCVCVDGSVFVMGGRNPHTWEFISDMFELDLRRPKTEEERSWRRCPPMRCGRTGFACVAAGGKIYVAGGQGEDVLTLASAEVYDIHRRCWEALPDLNVPRTECNGAVVEDRICVIGGYSSSDMGMSCCLEDDDILNTFWVSSADTLRFGSRSWETVDDTSTLLKSCEIRSGMLQSVHSSVLKDLIRRCCDDGWKTIEGKIVASSSAIDENSAALMVLGAAVARGREVYASACWFDGSSGKVRVSLCGADATSWEKGGLIAWKRIDCPFELGRYGTSCFLIQL